MLRVESSFTHTLALFWSPMHKYTLLTLPHIPLCTHSNTCGEHMCTLCMCKDTVHTHTLTRERTDEAVGLILQVFLLASSPLSWEDISSLANLSFRQLWGSESAHDCVYEGVCVCMCNGEHRKLTTIYVRACKRSKGAEALHLAIEVNNKNN